MIDRALLLLAILAAGAPALAVARPSLVCRTTARVPFSSTQGPGLDGTRIFTRLADLLEERQSGSSLVRHWFVVSETTEQVVAVNGDRSFTLLLDQPDGQFSESGVGVQRRGYCRLNALP